MTNKKEEWREIPDYEGIYMISDRGRVKSLNYRGQGKEGILKPGSSKGYLLVSLSKDGKKKYRTVHSIVAQAFLNHTPCGFKLVVDHIDNNPMNNNLSNLQLISHRENLSKDRKGSSKYTGVSWNKRDKSWVAQIGSNGKKKSLGYFTNEIDASKAYQRALKNNTV